MNLSVVFVAGEAPESETLNVPETSTLRQVLALSALARRVNPHGDLRVGVFGQVCLLDQVLEEGDRVEIYRPLQIDPKEARRMRAEVARKRKAKGS